MTDSYAAWAARHPQAAAELRAILEPPYVPPAAILSSESRVLSAVRLEAAKRGWYLWRNNRGAMTDDHGNFVRFGLGNESAPLDKRLKSSDLIGWRPIVITAAMVGRTIAQFVTAETKRPGWRLTAGDARGQAQSRWIELVVADGGYGKFIDGEGQL